MPKKPWLSSKMTAGRLEAMKKAIVGLEMTVEEVEGSFKLSQHKSETDYAAIAGSLAAQADAGAQQIAHLMRQARPDAFANQRPLPTKRTSSKGPCHDPHRQPSAQNRRRATKPAVFVDGGSGTTGLGIARAPAAAERRRGEEHCRGQAQGCRRQAGADGGGRSRHPLPARRCREGNRCADRQHGRFGAQGARRIDGVSRRQRLGLRFSGTHAGPGRQDPRPRAKSPIPAAIRPAALRCCGRWSMPACCLRTIPSPSTR